MHAVASRIIEVSLEIGVKPEVGLGFFTASDWERSVDGCLGPDELTQCIEYAKKLYEQTKAGVRLVEVSEIARIN